jgi:hypothetical protein
LISRRGFRHYYAAAFDAAIAAANSHFATPAFIFGWLTCHHCCFSLALFHLADGHFTPLIAATRCHYCHITAAFSPAIISLRHFHFDVFFDGQALLPYFRFRHFAFSAADFRLAATISMVSVSAIDAAATLTAAAIGRFLY